MSSQADDIHLLSDVDDRELSIEDLDIVSGGLVMYNVDGKPVARYHLENAWPSKP